MMTYKTQ